MTAALSRLWQAVRAIEGPRRKTCVAVVDADILAGRIVCIWGWTARVLPRIESLLYDATPAWVGSCPDLASTIERGSGQPLQK